MDWWLSYRAEPVVCPLADRHYSRQTIGSPQFVPPGRCLVLRTKQNDAYWVSSWPYQEFTKHRWAGAWMCTAFRNEGSGLSSDLIRQAVAVTMSEWEIPELGMVTFVDASKVKRKRDPGRCFLKAGFRHVGETKGGLLAFQLLPEDMPPADFAVEQQKRLIA